MESRGNPAGGQYAAAPPVWTSEPARAVWWLLAGKDDEDSTLQISVLTFCKTKGDRDMKKLSLALVILGLTGCASMEDLRSTKPIITASSDKTSSVLAQCILQKWQQQTVFNVYMQPRGTGFTVYLDGQWEVADIDAAGSGSKVSLYKKSSILDAPYKQYADWVNDCL